MAQHFLLSAEARTLSLKQIFTMPDKVAFDIFKDSRWGEGDPVCPVCGHRRALLHRHSPAMPRPKRLLGRGRRCGKRPCPASDAR
ncbi:MAG: transposase [Proteobacteria bacterium]|nr:transposase [Pseudomonadota bacterium]